jgi:hypothetical protein
VSEGSEKNVERVDDKNVDRVVERNEEEPDFEAHRLETGKVTDRVTDKLTDRNVD